MLLSIFPQNLPALPNFSFMLNDKDVSYLEKKVDEREIDFYLFPGEQGNILYMMCMRKHIHRL
jgi:hypothetical protein